MFKLIDYIPEKNKSKGAFCINWFEDKLSDNCTVYISTDLAIKINKIYLEYTDILKDLLIALAENKTLTRKDIIKFDLEDMKLRINSKEYVISLDDSLDNTIIFAKDYDIKMYETHLLRRSNV